MEINNVEYKLTEKLNKEVINEILKIEKEKGLTAERIVEEASKESSSLHNLFEWDNKKAGHLYRLQQARVIINEVRVIIKSKEYYAFENVRIEVPNQLVNGVEYLDESQIKQRVYKPISEILNDEDLRKQIISSALRQHEYWEKQNENYSELIPIVKSARKVRKELQRKWQKKN